MPFKKNQPRQPLTKGGWRTKNRRITPGMMENYWNTLRFRRLRWHWPKYRPSWQVVDYINEVPAPKQVTLWLVKLMASHIGLRRPADIGVFTRESYNLGLEYAHKRRVKANATVKLAPKPEKRTHAMAESVKPLKKVGRRKKPPVPVVRHTSSPGLSMGRAYLRRIPKPEAVAKRKYIRKKSS